MKCFYHTDREAIATCQHCGKALCRECAAKYNPCLCDECKSILDAADRQAESDKRQKYLDALVDTRSEFIRACIAGVVVGLAFYSMFAGGCADAGSRVTCFVLGFFVPFGWKLLTYLQSFIHSPQPRTEFRVEKRYFEENRAVWRALEDAQAAGKVRVIGVSNFLRDDLKNLLSACRVKPMVNQILLHISNTDLVDYCKAQGIQVETYSPIAHGEAPKTRPSPEWRRSTACPPPGSASAMSSSWTPWPCPRRRTPATWRTTRTPISSSPRTIWKC